MNLPYELETFVKFSLKSLKPHLPDEYVTHEKALQNSKIQIL